METKTQTYYERAKYDLENLIENYSSDVVPFAKWYMGEENSMFIEKKDDFKALGEQLMQDLHDEAKQKGEDSDDIFQVSEKLHEFIMLNIPF